MTKIKGTVKNFFEFRNFGFITAEDSKEYFVHISSVEYKKAFHYTNCRPLWAIDNIKKGNKFAAAMISFSAVRM